LTREASTGTPFITDGAEAVCYEVGGLVPPDRAAAYSGLAMRIFVYARDAVLL
jgi:hypothetical protein